MKLEIVSPEATLFTGEVSGITVPGLSGEFQMLNNHAPIVSLLAAGPVTIYGNATAPSEYKDQFKTVDGNLQVNIAGGVVEMKDNKAIILAD